MNVLKFVITSAKFSIIQYAKDSSYPWIIIHRTPLSMDILSIMRTWIGYHLFSLATTLDTTGYWLLANWVLLDTGNLLATIHGTWCSTRYCLQFRKWYGHCHQTFFQEAFCCAIFLSWIHKTFSLFKTATWYDIV